jgi:membrane dipeptidase
MTRLTLTIALAAAAAAWPLGTHAQSSDPLAHARTVLSEVPLIDGHNDYPWAVRENSPDRDLAKLDIRGRQPKTMTDIPRLREGHVGAQFWSVYVPVEMKDGTAVTATLEEIDTVHRMMARYADTFELARTPADVERIFKAGRIASMIGVEGGHSIDDSLAVLRMYFALGARYMTLTHSSNTDWADSSTDEPAHHGLTPFGEAVVGEMNRLGMLVDLSHVSPDTMRAALRVTKAPVIFSHSSARALCDVPRNVPDDVLKMLPQNGGVVMVTFVPGFISPAVAEWEKQSEAQEKQLQQAHPDDAAAVKAAMDAWRQAHPAPRATIAEIADHIDHIRQVAGIDHIGIGSDFDGITSTPEGMEDVSTYPKLFAELVRRGYSDADLKKIAGLNLLRVWRQADAVAAKLQKTEGPSMAIVKTGME